MSNPPLATIPLDDFSNTKATTSWVNIILEYSQRPRCAANKGLNVRITKGRIRKEGCSKDFLNDSSYIPSYFYTNGVNNISVVANKTEYAWLRYSDNQIVVSEATPTISQGDLIAIIYSGTKSITKIENYDGWGCPPSYVVFCCSDEEAPSLQLAPLDKNINQEDIEGLAYVILSKNPPNRDPRNPSEVWLQVRGNYRALFWAVSVNSNIAWMNVCSSIAVGKESPNTTKWIDEDISSEIPGQLYFNEITNKLWINVYGTWKIIET